VRQRNGDEGLICQGTCGTESAYDSATYSRGLCGAETLRHRGVAVTASDHLAPHFGVAAAREERVVASRGILMRLFNNFCRVGQ